MFRESDPPILVAQSWKARLVYNLSNMPNEILRSVNYFSKLTFFTTIFLAASAASLLIVLMIVAPGTALGRVKVHGIRGQKLALFQGYMQLIG